MELSDIHDCDPCRGKIVLIQTDKKGNTYCGYCHEKVNYGKYVRAIASKMDIGLLGVVKNGRKV